MALQLVHDANEAQDHARRPCSDRSHAVLVLERRPTTQRRKRPLRLEGIRNQVLKLTNSTGASAAVSQELPGGVAVDTDSRLAYPVALVQIPIIRAIKYNQWVFDITSLNELPSMRFLNVNHCPEIARP